MRYVAPGSGLSLLRTACMRAAAAVLFLLVVSATVFCAETSEKSSPAPDREYYDKVGESPNFRKADPRNVTEGSTWKNLRSAIGHKAAREASVVIIFVIVAVAFMVDFAARRRKEDEGGVEQRQSPFSSPPFSGIDVLLCVVPLLFLATRYFFYPWNILFVPSEDIFFPTFDLPADPRTVLAYLVERPARPMVPFRLMLSGLFLFHRSVSLLSSVSFLFTGATLVLAYVMVRRHTLWRLPALAVAAALSFCPGIDYGLIDIRGYMFAVFFTLLSVFLYLEFMRKQNSLSALFWLFSMVVAITSYPSSIAVAVGLFLHYLLFDRRGLSVRVRRIAAAHFFLTGLCIAVFSPLLIGNIGHKVDHLFKPAAVNLEITAYHVFTAVCMVFCLAAFGHFRKRGGGAILFSAAAGSVTLLLLMSVIFVLRADRYLLFVLPLNMVCLGVAAESVFLALRGRGFLFAAAVAALLIIFLSTPAYLGLRSSLALRQYLLETDRAVREIARVMDEKTDDAEPVLIYPQEFFFTYLCSRYDFNDLRTKGSALSKLREKRLREGGDLRSFENIHTSWPPIENPDVLFGKSSRVVVGYRSVLIARATISSIKNFQQSYEKSVRDTYTRLYRDCTVEVEDASFVIMLCGQSPAGGGEE